YAQVTSRKLNDKVARAFPFTIEYRSEQPDATSPRERFFRLTAIGAPGVDVSFVQPSQPTLREITIRLAKNRSFSWSVHATAALFNSHGRFRIEVVETDSNNTPKIA